MSKRPKLGPGDPGYDPYDFTSDEESEGEKEEEEDEEEEEEEKEGEDKTGEEGGGSMETEDSGPAVGKLSEER